MAAQIWYEDDGDLSVLDGKKVAIIGYGSQGHAHALNLRDSGVDVVVGLRPNSKSVEFAKEQGLEVKSVPEAAAEADVIMILAPDQYQKGIWENDIEPNIKEGAALAFAHGFNIHYGYIKPSEDHPVFMVAPKGPGHIVLKMIVDLMNEGGLNKDRWSCSDTAQYGDYVNTVIDEHVRERMQYHLKRIQDGSFAQEFMDDQAAGAPKFKQLQEEYSNVRIEEVGPKLRAMFSWNNEAAKDADEANSFTGKIARAQVQDAE